MWKLKNRNSLPDMFTSYETYWLTVYRGLLAHVISYGCKTWSPSYEKNIVACRAVVMQRPRDGWIYEGHLVATARLHVPAATNTNGKIEELCFLCGPCLGVISKGQR
jgi:NAD-dependent dihydropyrimidine dehydrogenase PreA subunit